MSSIFSLKFHLCFEGLLNVCTQCAPFVSLLQSFSCQMHPSFHFIYFHQDLWNTELKLMTLISKQSNRKQLKNWKQDE